MLDPPRPRRHAWPAAAARLLPQLLLVHLATVPSPAGAVTNYASADAVRPFRTLDCKDLRFTPGGGCSCDTVIPAVSVHISDGFEPADDTLWCPLCATQFIVKPTYDASVGVLRLTGDRSIREYARALATVQFATASPALLPRRVTYTMGDAIYVPLTDRFYRLRSFPDVDCAGGGCRWDDAQIDCSRPASDYFGLVGYLFAPTTAAARGLSILTYPVTNAGAVPTAWVGCTDAAQEDQWRWVVGPDACAPYDWQSTSSPAEWPTRSGCDMGLPFVPGPEPCGAPGCGSGRLVGAGAFTAGEPSQVTAPPAGRGVGGSWTTAGRDFGAQATPGGGILARTLAPGSGFEQVYYCEYTHAIGTLCMAAGDVTGTEYLTALANDECAGGQGTQATRVPDAGEVPVVATVPPCSAIEGQDCDCDLIVDALYVTIDVGYVQGADQLACGVCGPTAAVDFELFSATDAFTAADAVLVLRVFTRVGTTGTMRMMLDVLGSVTFSTTAMGRQPRRVVWNLGDAWWVPETGHYYDAINLPMTYFDAVDACGLILGYNGYLAVLNNEVERNVVTNRLSLVVPSAWVGASDVGTEGTWRWVMGPEGCPPRVGCAIFPLNPTTEACEGTECNGGLEFSAEDYAWFDTARGQPDDYRGSTRYPMLDTTLTGEHFAAFYMRDGKSRLLDYSGTQSTVQGALCEYGTDNFCVPDGYGRGVLFLEPEVLAPQTTCTYCTHRDDCGAQQTCVDPSPARDDWYCVCDAPTTGMLNPAGPAVCVLDECTADCPTCVMWRIGSCGVSQSCFDVDTSPLALGDWVCRCDSPATGANATAAVATCEIDECASVACGIHQRCVDTNTDPEALMDWRCECEAPATGMTAPTTPATCSIDECTAACATCIDPTHGCGAMQECADVNASTASLSDWECRCTLPAVGAPASLANASCTLDECVADCQTCFAVVAMGTCGMGQSCVDTQQGVESVSDWECRCDPPSMGASAVFGPAACTLDECTTVCPTCIDPVFGCGAYQVCDDLDTDAESLSDWTCQCAPPAAGFGAALANTTCILDECVPWCSTCIGDFGCSVGQACVDLNTDAASTGDWACDCVPPAVGMLSIAANGTCNLDECVERGCATCNTFGCRGVQVCDDPDADAASLADWTCSCRAPAVGASATARNATCTIDECAVACATCIGPHGCAAGQACVDTDLDESMMATWECACVPPGVGPSTALRNATCGLDECLTGCPTCIDDSGCGVGQTCIDDNTDASSLRDWDCVCVEPAVGTPQRMADAMCALDECASACPTCIAAAGCGAMQACVDSDTDAGALADWECVCVAPATGAAQRIGNATCTLDECEATCPTCMDARGCGVAQACNDENTDAGSVNDWVCACVSPARGTVATTSPAVCVLDECAVACPTCIASSGCGAGQVCVDADTGAASTGDWACECVPPSVGASAVGANATCFLDECAERTCRTCNAWGCRGGQACEDPNTSVGSLADWVCECVAPAVGVDQLTANATCVLDECTNACPSCVDPVSGCGLLQACLDVDTDASSLLDWECRCVPPAQGASAIAGSAACYLDECVADCATCMYTTVGGCGPEQRCMDNATAVGSTGDWWCECRSDATLQTRAAPVATCVVDTPVPPLPEEEQRLVTTGTITSVAGAAAGGPGPAMRVLVVMADCRDQADVHRYPWVLHPSRIRVLGSLPAGAVVGNFGIVAGCYLLGYAVYRMLMAIGPQTLGAAFAAEADAQGLVRFPSVVIVVFNFLYQGISLGALELVVRAPTPELLAVGSAASAVCLAVPLLVLYRVTIDIPHHASFELDPFPRSRFVAWLIGPGEWVSRHPDVHWVKRWSMAVRTYREPTAWFLVYEMAGSLAVSAAQAPNIGSAVGCGHVKLCCGAVFTTLLVLELHHRPHCITRNTIADAVALTLQALAMIIMAIGYYAFDGDETFVGFTLTVFLLMGATVILTARALVDMLALLYVVATGRRNRMQMCAFEKALAAEAAAAEMKPLVDAANIHVTRTLSLAMSPAPSSRDALAVGGDEAPEPRTPATVVTAKMPSFARLFDSDILQQPATPDSPPSIPAADAGNFSHVHTAAFRQVSVPRGDASSASGPGVTPTPEDSLFSPSLVPLRPMKTDSLRVLRPIAGGGGARQAPVPVVVGKASWASSFPASPTASMEMPASPTNAGSKVLVFPPRGSAKRGSLRTQGSLANMSRVSVGDARGSAPPGQQRGSDALGSPRRSLVDAATPPASLPSLIPAAAVDAAGIPRRQLVSSARRDDPLAASSRPRLALPYTPPLTLNSPRRPPQQRGFTTDPLAPR